MAGVKVTPAQLNAAAKAMRDSARGLGDTLTHSAEPSIQNPDQGLYGEVMFGPADEVAAQYFQLVRDFAGFTTAFGERMNAGADVFARSATGFEQLSAKHGADLGGQ